MSRFRDNAANRAPRRCARPSVKCTLGILVFFVLFLLPPETRAQLPPSMQNEINALRVKIAQCWKPPADISPSTQGHVSLRVQFKPDGSLASKPVIVEDTASLGPALAKSAIQAIETCQPFTMLKPEDYAWWKDIQMDFDPRTLSGR
jgi:hypothetical protein